MLGARYAQFEWYLHFTFTKLLGQSLWKAVVDISAARKLEFEKSLNK